METGPVSDSTLDAVDQIVASTGPYMFHRASHFCKRLSARLAGKASPPQSTFNFLLLCQPDSSSNLQVAGVACITVAVELSILCCSCMPSEAISALTKIRRAPT